MSFINEMAFKNLLELDGPGPDLNIHVDDMIKRPGIDYIAVPSRKTIYFRNTVPNGCLITYLAADDNDYDTFCRPDGNPTLYD